MENREVARILRETASLLEIDGAQIGRYRSYEKAAELVGSLSEPITELAKDTERLTALPGIGDRMAEHIQEILKTGAYNQELGKKVEAVTPAGSLRRGKETIGDLDLLVTLPPGRDSAKGIDAIADHILKYPAIDQILARGENKVSFRLDSGMQVDVRLLEKESFGAALLYFTGSKEHNVTLRGRANKMELTLNEYALSTLKGERDRKSTR